MSRYETGYMDGYKEALRILAETILDEAEQFHPQEYRAVVEAVESALEELRA